MRDTIFDSVLDWKADRKRDPRIRVYDFSDGQLVMPLWDHEAGSYLTSSIAFLVHEGHGPLLQGARMPREADGVADLGNGWKMLAVEFSYQATPKAVKEALTRAESALVEAIS